MTYTTSDFKLTLAESDFIWDNAPRPKLPLLRWPDRTLCEPALYFFGYSAANGRVPSISSMRTEASSIREWLVFLANNGLDILHGNDTVMEKWRTSMGWIVTLKKSKRALVRNDQLKNARIERKLHHIFVFYLFLPKAMPYGENGTLTPIFVGAPESDEFSEISSKYGLNRRGKQTKNLVWRKADSVSVDLLPPKVPSRSDLIAIYNYLRGKAFRKQQQLKLAHPDEFEQILSDRNWLLGKIMAEAGLRCEEVSDFTVEALSKCLHENGITKQKIALETIADQVDLKREIKQRILSVKDGAEHAFLLVKIRGKGGKKRHVPFPPSLICDLLEIGVWGSRNKQISRWKERENTSSQEPFLFLSMKSKERLGPGSISGILGDAFRKTHIKGSAHKLRGVFATVTAAALWREYFGQHQFRFDDHLANRVLDQLARYMGHSVPDTTVKFYVDQQLWMHLTRIGTPEALMFGKMWDEFVLRGVPLSKKRSDIMLETARRIGESEDDSKYIAALAMINNDTRFAAKAPVEPKKLQLVFNADRDVE